MTVFHRSGLLTGGLAGLLMLAACDQKKPADQAAAGTSAAADSTQTSSSQSAMPTATSFGKDKAGQEVQLFTLTNAHGLKATITNYGGTVTSLLVPDKQGKLGNVVLGFNDMSGYQSPEFVKAGPYFGALIG
ncbi:MAG TPA: hypothetical protein VF598_02900, partial [Hymenobacter sp.]